MGPTEAFPRSLGTNIFLPHLNELPDSTPTSLLRDEVLEPRISKRRLLAQPMQGHVDGRLRKRSNSNDVLESPCATYKEDNKALCPIHSTIQKPGSPRRQFLKTSAPTIKIFTAMRMLIAGILTIRSYAQPHANPYCLMCTP